MKKAFQIFGLALIASSLIFTACKKDEEESNNQQQEQTVGQGSLTTIFDGVTTSSFGYMNGVYASIADTVRFRTRAAVARTNEGVITLPYFDCMLASYVDTTTHWDVKWLEYGDNGAEIDSVTNFNDGVFTGNWGFYGLMNGSKITDFDATNVTLDYTLIANMISYYEYYIEDKTESASAKKNLTATATKFHYVRASSK